MGLQADAMLKAEQAKCAGAKLAIAAMRAGEALADGLLAPFKLLGLKPGHLNNPSVAAPF